MNTLAPVSTHLVAQAVSPRPCFAAEMLHTLGVFFGWPQDFRVIATPESVLTAVAIALSSRPSPLSKPLMMVRATVSDEPLCAPQNPFTASRRIIRKRALIDTGDGLLAMIPHPDAPDDPRPMWFANIAQALEAIVVEQSVLHPQISTWYRGEWITAVPKPSEIGMDQKVAYAQTLKLWPQVLAQYERSVMEYETAPAPTSLRSGAPRL